MFVQKSTRQSKPSYKISAAPHVIYDIRICVETGSCFTATTPLFNTDADIYTERNLMENKLWIIRGVPDRLNHLIKYRQLNISYDMDSSSADKYVQRQDRILPLPKAEVVKSSSSNIRSCLCTYLHMYI